MQYTTLGKTGLKVSVAALGCGGNSRIGLGAGKSVEEAAEIVRAALDRGVGHGLAPCFDADMFDL